MWRCGKFSLPPGCPHVIESTEKYGEFKREETMIVGVPKEIKEGETRVALTPEGTKQLMQNGHTILMEKGTGLKSGFTDKQFRDCGATILPTADKVWKMADLIIKVKEPLPTEFRHFRENQLIFTYLHLASAPQLAKALCKSKVMAFGYETVETSEGELPLLIPMSEVAGRVATQVGTRLLHAISGDGKGLLLGGVTGTSRGIVTVVGGGVVGRNAAEVAAGLGAEVAILDINKDRLSFLKNHFNGRVHCLASTPDTLTKWVSKSDLLIGAVLVAGDKAPKVVTKKMIQGMQPGSVIVDVAIDQGGCMETSKPTSHKKPTYLKYNVLHYCVPNMPALTPKTSTEALTSVTFPYVLKLASMGAEKAEEDKMLGSGLQTKNGKVVHPVVSKLFKSLS
jgi:alanine dehydrogenase